jgi:pyrroline-5-carboxylate reductase
MGIAVTSGVLATVSEIQGSSSSSSSNGSGSGVKSLANGASAPPSPGSSQLFDGDLESLPNAYIATVSREESARRLSKTFKALPGGAAVKVQAGNNIEAVSQSDVVLLW